MISPSASLRTMSRAEAEGTEPGGEAVCRHDSGRVIAGDQGLPGDTPGRRSSAPGPYGSGTPASTPTASSRWPTGRRCPSTRSPVTRARRRSTSPRCRRSHPPTGRRRSDRPSARSGREAIVVWRREVEPRQRSVEVCFSIARRRPSRDSGVVVALRSLDGCQPAVHRGRDAGLRRPAAGSRRTAGPRRRPPRA